MSQKTCFVIMPFGPKEGLKGERVNFDKVYDQIIAPAVRDAGITCLRSDKLISAGWIHRKMIGHVYRADVAVVDITFLNPNVFYELGVRHALRKSVTVLIKKTGTVVPFNIQGMNVIEYGLSEGAAQKARESITAAIRKGLDDREVDSLVHDVMKLQIRTQSPPLAEARRYDYPMEDGSDRSVGIVTGDIESVRDIDAWVNSENTNMQMARFFDRSVSSTIRYLGATQTPAGHVVKDVIADELAKAVGEGNVVAPATAIATGSGMLKRTHGVKRILHVAAVIGQPGHGYAPIPNVEQCVRSALRLVDSSGMARTGIQSVLFPLLGTGTGRGDAQTIVSSLIETALAYLKENPKSRVRRIYFLAWTQEDLELCQSILDRLSGSLTRPVTGKTKRRASGEESLRGRSKPHR